MRRPRDQRVFAFLAGAIIAARMLDADIDVAEVLLEGPAELDELAEEMEGATMADELRALAEVLAMVRPGDTPAGIS